MHDIGKNLVDIILSNNGYTVVNLGIKQPVSAILEAAEEHRADVIGMSGLLVKSHRRHEGEPGGAELPRARRRCPVILGGAALTRAYVEQDLAEIYEGEVRYARDAFEGLRLMDAIIAVKRGVPGAALPELRERRVDRPRHRRGLPRARARCPARSDVATDDPCRPRRSGATGSSRASRWPTTRRCSTSGPPSWASGGSRPPAAATGRPTRSWSRPRAGRGCATWLDRLQTEQLLEAGGRLRLLPVRAARATT